MQVYEGLTLDFLNRNFRVINAKQGDTGRILDITIHNNSVPVNLAGHTVKVFITKPDGTIIFNNATIVNTAQGLVRVELTNQALAVPGKLNCELILYGADSSVISSQIFNINVISSMKDDNAPESSNEFGALTQAMAEIADLEGNYAPRLNSVESSLAEIATEFDEVLAGITVDSEVINARNSGVKTKTFGTLDARLEDIEADSYFPIKNVVINGNFGSTESWTANGATMSVSNNELTMTSNGANSFPHISQNSDSNAVVGDTIYGRAIVDILDASATISLRFNSTGAVGQSDTLLFQASNPTSGSRIVLSGVSKVPTNYSGKIKPILLSTYASASEGNGKRLKFSNFIMINLTETFGAGNEPTKAEMDSILTMYPNSFFNGTVNLAQNSKMLKYLLNQIRGKASIVQEAWLTPTLVNAWANHATLAAEPVGYYKDTLGIVRLRGVINGGAVGSIAFTLPAGYRPSANKYCVSATSGTATGRVDITSTGVVTVTSFNSWISLDSISFRGV